MHQADLESRKQQNMYVHMLGQSPLTEKEPRGQQDCCCLTPPSTAKGYSCRPQTEHRLVQQKAPLGDSSELMITSLWTVCITHN